MSLNVNISSPEGVKNQEQVYEDNIVYVYIVYKR